MIDPTREKRFAILSIDLQNGFFGSGSLLGKNNIPIHKRSIAKQITTLRERLGDKIKCVVWIKSIYDFAEKPKPKYLGICRDGKPNNGEHLSGTHFSKKGNYFRSDYEAKFIPEVLESIKKEDLIIKKRWYSAFTDTCLFDELKANEITDIIITGITTNTCVRATTVDAYHLGFNVYVPFDATEAGTHDLKKNALTDIKRYYGSTLSIWDIIRLNTRPFNIEVFGEGDSFLIHGFFDKFVADYLFLGMKKSTKWNTMLHKGGEVPRLISIQNTDYPNCRPIYRHPAEAQPKSEIWNRNSEMIRHNILTYLGLDINHALVQYYRGGTDYISEHADKTLDIRKGTPVVNVSLGAKRTMKLRSKYTKEDGTRNIQNVNMTHGSLFVLGWKTNQKWTHAIRQDKRIDKIKDKDELAFDGERISFTGRDIATFMDKETGMLFGQGAPEVPVEGDAEKMLIAFGTENKSYDLEWDDIYSGGFSALNFEEL